MLKKNILAHKVTYQKKSGTRLRYYLSFSNTPDTSLSAGGILVGLFGSIAMTQKVAKAAKTCQIFFRNSSRAVSLSGLFEDGTKIAMILIDWDLCEAEAYKLLGHIRDKEHLKKAPVLGFVSQAKSALIPEAQKAGCDRVLKKSEFINSLDSIIARCAL